MKHKKNKPIGLNKLETRFLLNLVLEEQNVLLSGLTDIKKPSYTNINNCKNKAIYERKIGMLKRKLQRLDRVSYVL